MNYQGMKNSDLKSVAYVLIVNINTGYAWCNKCNPGWFLREGRQVEILKYINLFMKHNFKWKVIIII